MYNNWLFNAIKELDRPFPTGSHAQPTFVQLFSRLIDNGIEATTREYGNIFDLTDQHMALVLDFMKKWDRLRECCGPQMSQKTRDELWAIGKNGSRYDFTNGMAACAGQNLDELERDMMQTQAYRLSLQNNGCLQTSYSTPLSMR